MKTYWIIAPNTVYKHGIVSTKPLESTHKSIVCVIEKTEFNKQQKIIQKLKDLLNELKNRMEE